MMLKKGKCEDYPDNELVARSLADQEFYYCIVERYETQLRRYVSRLTNLHPEEVNDLLQDIFLKAYLNLNDFDQSLKFSSWLYRIAHNETISNYRKRKSRGLDQIAQVEDWQELATEFSIETDVDHMITKEQLTKVFSKMDDGYREILILKYLEGKEYSEISDILRKPMGTIATQINRAKKQFRKITEENQIKF